MIAIYGSSDDLVEVSGCKGAREELNTYVYSGSNGNLVWRGDFIDPSGGQMRVYGIYDGCWHFSVGQVDEDVPLPSWPVSITQRERAGGDPSYTVQVEIDAPDGTRLTNVWPTQDA